MSNSIADKKPGDVSILLCGQAGQGIQTVEHLLMRILKSSGYCLFTGKEYMSRVRGGMNSTSIRISGSPVSAPSNRIDILVPLDKGGVSHVSCMLTSNTVVIGEKDSCGGEIPNGVALLDVPFSKIAAETGNKVYSNTVAVGALLFLLGLELEPNLHHIGEFFSGKPDDVVKKNLEAAGKGYASLAGTGTARLQMEFKSSPDVKEQLLLSGAEAVSLGALAGGCNFISSYPMSPSTGVLSFLAQHGSEFGIVVEQAEDEIAAINMAIGAWYAGARAMVTTSGGGFALMTEGLSLAGMLESPLVIHLAQRPGPATGLPTRTEQGDLEFALYGGHGEFPRIIFAPGTLEEGFTLAHRAFSVADKYQVPVIILTDQFFMDSCCNTPVFKLDDVDREKHFTGTSAGYRRYEMAANGISPRGIPGLGDGLVCVDSDEHDQEGHITENSVMRTMMVDKRLKKLESSMDDFIPPRLFETGSSNNLIVCWGSALSAVREAVEILGRDDTAVLHFSQVFPLDAALVREHFSKAEKTILVEGNATGQFGRILKGCTGVDFHGRILRYNGLSFASDELAAKINSCLQEGK
ncbi:MAG TPA: 2-oxoacid:acceptor oxidoreductase subunit alpha [Lentisphaeria bacterium]|nr:MAG: 2-oxoacid:ferredoxin oxidoreductase subunit alpha [Lentisphaerae bacterium GWF2_50_93]HCE45680.1 2-oxoacid:acceptor oxidoreductase subunit alpha [Lentisphaeria bacterium]